LRRKFGAGKRFFDEELSAAAAHPTQILKGDLSNVKGILASRLCVSPCPGRAAVWLSYSWRHVE
jgi:hypothetical protein